MPEKTSLYETRLQALRQEMQKHDLDGYLVPRADEFQGEYVPAYAERLAWLTGFTGSAGTTVILQDKAVVLSDGRYYPDQLTGEVDTSVFAIADYTFNPAKGANTASDGTPKTTLGRWTSEHAARGSKIGFNPKLFTPAQIEKMREETARKGIELVAVQEDLVDIVWGNDRPPPPSSTTEIFPTEIAGQPFEYKVTQVVERLKAEDASAIVISSLDSIAWLLNVRGGDIPYLPVSQSYLIVRDNGSVDWFIDPEKITDEVRSHLGDKVRIHDFKKFEASLTKIAHDSHRPIWADAQKTSCWVHDIIKNQKALPLRLPDPCIGLRASKTPQELNAMRAAHIRDGHAVVKFMHWFDNEGSHGGQTEISVEKKLESFRAEAGHIFRGPSFPTIAGLNGNGAIVHYRATDETSQAIAEDGLLLVDSGAQYSDGTTDITRTLAVGTPTDDMKARYTQVLRAYFAVAAHRFPPGTSGAEIDAVARDLLKEKYGYDMPHAVGHGVGVYLSVHENNGSGLSPRATAPLKPGMIVSIEPGYYESGQFGIRHENLAVVREADDGMLEFEIITLAPFDRDLIDMSLLSPEEIQQIDAYHQRVYEGLQNGLDEERREWLRKKTAPLPRPS